MSSTLGDEQTKFFNDNSKTLAPEQESVNDPNARSALQSGGIVGISGFNDVSANDHLRSEVSAGIRTNNARQEGRKDEDEERLVTKQQMGGDPHAPSIKDANSNDTIVDKEATNKVKGGDENEIVVADESLGPPSVHEGWIPLPKQLCRAFLSGRPVCNRIPCKYFHGDEAALSAAKAKGHNAYRPLDARTDYMEEDLLTISAQLSGASSLQSAAPPDLLPGRVNNLAPKLDWPAVGDPSQEDAHSGGREGGASNSGTSRGSICATYYQGQCCKLGVACPFLHTPLEYRMMDRRVCAYHRAGSCGKGSQCAYFHGTDEERQRLIDQGARVYHAVTKEAVPPSALAADVRDSAVWWTLDRKEELSKRRRDAMSVANTAASVLANNVMMPLPLPPSNLLYPPFPKLQHPQGAVGVGALPPPPMPPHVMSMRMAHHMSGMIGHPFLMQQQQVPNGIHQNQTQVTMPLLTALTQQQQQQFSMQQQQLPRPQPPLPPPPPPSYGFGGSMAYTNHNNGNGTHNTSTHGNNDIPHAFVSGTKAQGNSANVQRQHQQQSVMIFRQHQLQHQPHTALSNQQTFQFSSNGEGSDGGGANAPIIAQRAAPLLPLGAGGSPKGAEISHGASNSNIQANCLSSHYAFAGSAGASQGSPSISSSIGIGGSPMVLNTPHPHLQQQANSQSQPQSPHGHHNSISPLPASAPSPSSGGVVPPTSGTGGGGMNVLPHNHGGGGGFMSGIQLSSLTMGMGGGGGGQPAGSHPHQAPPSASLPLHNELFYLQQQQQQQQYQQQYAAYGSSSAANNNNTNSNAFASNASTVSGHSSNNAAGSTNVGSLPSHYHSPLSASVEGGATTTSQSYAYAGIGIGMGMNINITGSSEHPMNSCGRAGTSHLHANADHRMPHPYPEGSFSSSPQFASAAGPLGGGGGGSASTLLPNATAASSSVGGRFGGEGDSTSVAGAPSSVVGSHSGSANAHSITGSTTGSNLNVQSHPHLTLSGGGYYTGGGGGGNSGQQLFWQGGGYGNNNNTAHLAPPSYASYPTIGSFQQQGNASQQPPRSSMLQFQGQQQHATGGFPQLLSLAIAGLHPSSAGGGMGMGSGSHRGGVTDM